VSIFAHRLPARTLAYLDTTTRLIEVVFFASVCWYSLQLLRLRLGEPSAGAGFDMGLYPAALVLGVTATFLFALGQLAAMPGRALAAEVSTGKPYVFAADGDVRVAVVDYGAKRSILRRLARLGAAVTVFPHNADPDELVAHDGVLLSNGPGDPDPLREETEIVRSVLGRVPVLGICLGHQLLGLATGHETFKLPFGHRGANHPVLERRTGRVLVTSQNHGFAVTPTDAQEATHVSLYDGTVEGFEFPELRARSVQFHPEAGPGPHDAWPILERWVEELRG